MFDLKSGVELNGRYVIQGVVGSGGYATVWRASDKQLNREVALKRLLRGPSASPAEDILALTQEAQKNAQLVHANIVQVYDIIEASGEHLIVMEFVDGQSLVELFRDRALKSETLPLDSGIAILRDILEGVGFAHSRGIMHRDLSPSNILMTSASVPKVGDFGIAKVVKAETDGSATEVSTLQGGTGNVNYMSPEQARGEPADFASDLFMVGIIGYLILSGRHPFAHPSGLFTIPELLLKQDFVPELPRPSPSSTTTQQRLFREYAAVVMRLLQKEKAGRFASALDAIDALDSVTPTVDCPKCGERIPDHFSFCGLCGTPLAVRLQAQPAKELQASDAQDPDELVEEGYRFSLERKWEPAIQRYRRALDIDATHKKAHRNLAFALNRVGRHEDAIALANAGLNLSGLLPEHRVSLLYERSVGQQSLRRYEEAFQTIQDALTVQPTAPRLLYSRARLQEFRGKFAEARQDARDVLKRIPDHAGALRLLEQYAV